MRFKLNQWLFFVVVILAAGCATMQSPWREAESVNTITAYEEYLKQNPESDLANQAHLQIERLCFERARIKDSVEAYEQFLKCMSLN